MPIHSRLRREMLSRSCDLFASGFMPAMRPAASRETGQLAAKPRVAIARVFPRDNYGNSLFLDWLNALAFFRALMMITKFPDLRRATVTLAAMPFLFFSHALVVAQSPAAQPAATAAITVPAAI